MKLRVAAGECLAAIALAVGHVSGAAAAPADERARADEALRIMEREGMHEVAFGLVASADSRSLDPSRDSPRARLREAAGLTLLALSSRSDVSASYLTSNKAVSKLLGIASESLDAPSALRGEWASRGLCYLETSAVLLLRAWKNDDPSCLKLLLDALDAGAVGLLSRLVTSRVHLKHHDRAYSRMRIKIAVCYMLAAMFGIAGDEDKNALGASRLYSAVDADCAAALAYGNANETAAPDGRTDLVASTVALLGATLPYARKFANEGADEPLPMMDLTQACLLAVGSMCGAAPDDHADSPDLGKAPRGKHSHLRSDAARMACGALTSSARAGDRGGGGAALLPSVLVGALGESLVVPALRLTLAIARNGDFEVRGDLARSGMLIPVGDILQHSLSSGERHAFSAAVAVVRLCGPCASVAGGSNDGSVASLQNSIRTLACVLMISESADKKTLLSLKYESLLALESLSSNEALHSTLVDTFPSLTEFLIQLDGSRTDVSSESEAIDTDDMVCSALKTIRSIISLPSSSPSSAAAVEGVISSLVKIMNRSHGGETNTANNSRKQEVSLELLHAIALGRSGDNMAGGKGTSLLSSGVLESVASLMGEGGISTKMTHLGLDIVEFIIADIDSTTNNSSHFNNPLLKDVMLRQFVNDMASQEHFLRALIATMVATSDTNISVSPLYGTPLLLPLDPAEDQSINVLFRISSLLLRGDVSGAGRNHFLHAFMLTDIRGAAETVSLAACVFLGILMDEVNGICVPQINPTDRSVFVDVNLPMIRSQLLEGLSSTLDECMAASNTSLRKHAETLIREFRIPQLCLRFCQSKQVFQAAFDLYENVVLPLPTDVLGDLLLADKSSLVALFDLVMGQNNSLDEHPKQTFALTLGNLAKAGMLSTAVERFGVRNNAIAALSAAMQGGLEDNTIDENEDSLPRICVESLAAILCDKNKQDELEITALEARIMATAIGKTLSSTVLNRFFTQASLETTFDMDHSSDRSAISRSPEARLLCSMASFPETLEMLRKVGGLEAIGLIAHEGELAAIRAIQKACELSPNSVVDVDAHLSIMDALIQVESKLVSTDLSNTGKLREVATSCIQIITALSQNRETMSAIISAEQSQGCLTASACIISASSKSLCQKSSVVEKENRSSVDTAYIPMVEKVIKSPEENTALLNHIDTTESINGDLKLDDLVLFDSSSFVSNPSSPLKSNHNHDVLEGIVAHLGAVKFAPGNDWIGIRLTGSSVGLGKNDGSVKGVRYFDCGDDNGDKNGVFARRNSVERQARGVIECETTNETATLEMVTEEEENNMPPVDTQQEQMWGCLLSNDDGNFTLERNALSLLLSFSSSKPHRDLVMKNEIVINSMTSIIELHSPALSDFQCNALNLLVSFTLHLQNPDAKLVDLLCSVVETRTRVLQISRDKRLLNSTKELLALAISGLENMFCSFMDVDEKLRSLKIVSDLFIFLADSLYKGSKSRRLAASVKDGVLFYHLSSFFALSLGTGRLRASILSVRFVSSSIRFIMMTGGLSSLDCHIPENKEGGAHWNAALSHCLSCLSCNMIQSSQDLLGNSFASVIADTEALPKSFQFCLVHIGDKKLGGASSISAKQMLERLERLPVG